MNIKEERTKTKILKNVLVDVVVEADLSGMMWFTHGRSIEEQAKQMERCVKEFEEFLRDHRSQDMVRLSVERKYKDICASCQNEWELDEFDEIKGCAHCGAILEENEVKDEH